MYVLDSFTIPHPPGMTDTITIGHYRNLNDLRYYHYRCFQNADNECSKIVCLKRLQRLVILWQDIEIELLSY